MKQVYCMVGYIAGIIIMLVMVFFSHTFSTDQLIKMVFAFMVSRALIVDNDK